MTSTGDERLRVLSYPAGDIIFIVYAVDDRKTFRNVIDIVSSKCVSSSVLPFSPQSFIQWAPEAAKHAPHIPVVLVANKIDKRGTEAETVSKGEVSSSITYDLRQVPPVTYSQLEQGVEMAKRIGAFYVETSVVTGEGIRKLFIHAARQLLPSEQQAESKEKKNKCIIA